jgi:hypothetical protein
MGKTRCRPRQAARDRLNHPVDDGVAAVVFVPVLSGGVVGRLPHEFAITIAAV